MRAIYTTLLAATVFAVLPQVTSAQPPGADGPRFSVPLIQALDADGDGVISKDEIAKAVDALKKLDKDGDGNLSREEYIGNFQRPGAQTGQPGQPGRPGGADAAARTEQFIARFLESDKNGDGKISKDEAPERLQQNFDRIDANSDGVLDKDELKVMAQRFGGAGQARPQRPEGQQPEGARPARPRPNNN